MTSFSDERVRAMLLGTRAFRRVPLPVFAKDGGEVPVAAVRLLSDAELDACRVEAQRQMRQTAKARGWDAVEFVDVDPTLLERHIHRQILWRAYYDPTSTGKVGDERQFFASPDELALLDSTTTDLLMQQYIEHAEIVNPQGDLTEAQVDAIVAALGKEQGAEVPWNAFAPATLRRFARSMALRLAAMPQTTK